MADRLTLTRAFELSGMESQTAERIATEIYDAIHENVATKSDIAALRADMRELEQRLKLWGGSLVIGLGSLIVATGGALFTALHYWPPR